MPPRFSQLQWSARCGRPPSIVGFMLVLATAVALALPSAVARAQVPEFRVVIHPDNPQASLRREFLMDAFLKKTTRWSDGERLQPVDLRPDSPVRKRFSESVLRRSVAAVRSYWAQRIFSGRGVPPPELESDEAVVGYVLKHRGAVGYVSAAAKLGQCKVVAVH